MLRINRSGGYPRSLQHEKVHVITARNTLFGIHKGVIHSQCDTNCSKTVLLACFQKGHARQLIDMFEATQRSGYPINRIVIDDTIDLRASSAYGASLLTFSTEELALPDLEKLCLLHYFDLYVTNELTKLGESLHLDCYEYKTYEHPNQGMLRKIMKDMWR